MEGRNFLPDATIIIQTQQEAHMALTNVEVGKRYVLDGNTEVTVSAVGPSRPYGAHVVHGVVSCTNLRDYDGGYFIANAKPL